MKYSLGYPEQVLVGKEVFCFLWNSGDIQSN